MERLDVCIVTKGEDRGGEPGKSRWTKVGAAFPTKQGGWSIRLDHDIAVTDRTNLVLVPPKPKDEGI